MNKNKAVLAKLDELIEQVKLTNAILGAPLAGEPELRLRYALWGQEEIDGVRGHRFDPVAIFKPVEDTSGDSRDGGRC